MVEHIMMKKQNFLWEWKEAGIIEFQWIQQVIKWSCSKKNLAGPEHNKHAASLCGHDKYYSTMQDGESHEQERVSGVAECS